MNDNNTDDRNWGYAFGHESMFLLPIDVIDELIRQHAVFACTTWGEVAQLDEDLVEEVLGMAGYGTYEQYRAHLDIVGAVPLPGVEGLMAESYDPDAELPGPDDEFDAHRLPPVADGDWPPAPALLMTAYLPDELVERFGRTYSTTFNGDFTELDPSRGDEILAACAALGMNVVPHPGFADVVTPSW